MRRMLALGALCALALGPRPARAQGRPTLTEIQPPEGIPGTNVRVVGTNFSEDKNDVTVLAGGKECLILEHSPEAIRFFIPLNPPPRPGNLKIEVRIGKETCSGTFRIVDYTLDKDGRVVEKNSAARREKERKGVEGAAEYLDPYVETNKLLKIVKLEISTGSNPTCHVECQTTLPPGMFITVGFGIIAGAPNKPETMIEQEIATHKVTVRGPVVKTTFGAPPSENWAGRVLLAGKYYAHVQFERSKQSALDLKRAGWMPGEKAWEAFDKQQREMRDLIVKKEIKDVGTPDDVKKQDDDIRGHYVELARATTDCLEVLERAYAAAGKSYHKKPAGGIDEAEWEKWAQERKLGLTEDEMRKLKADNRFITGSGFFDPGKWQKWVEEDFYKRLGDVYKKHDDMKKKYITSRDQRIEVEGDYLLTIVLKLTQLYSGEIYGRQKPPIEVPLSLRAPKEFAGGGFESVAVSRGHFEGHRKLLLERLGLGNFDPTGKKDDKKK